MLTLFSRRLPAAGATIRRDASPRRIRLRKPTESMEQDYVLIVEPNLTGHRWRYVEWTMQACAEAGYPCMLVTECANEDHRLPRQITAANRPDQQIAFVDPEEQPRGLMRDPNEYWR